MSIRGLTQNKHQKNDVMPVTIKLFLIFSIWKINYQLSAVYNIEFWHNDVVQGVRLPLQWLFMQE